MKIHNEMISTSIEKVQFEKKKKTFLLGIKSRFSSSE